MIARKALRPRLILLLCLLCGGMLLAAPVAAAPAAATPTQKTVLILQPYQFSLPGTLLAMEAIQSEFSRADDLALDVYVEYLDFNRFPDDAYRQELLRLLTLKYGSKTIDLLLVNNEVALNWWLEHRSGIAPTAPVVFYNVDSDKLADLALPADVTGASDTVDYIPTVEWILSARPATREIILVYGAGQADREYSHPLQDLETAMADRVRFVDLSGLPLAEIEQHVAALPPTSIILYHVMFEDAAGVHYRPIDVLQALVAAASVPVFSSYDSYIGAGTAGGYLYSIEQQARNAAQMSLRVLHGEVVGAIPIQINQSNRFIFDHLVLQRFNILLSDLPPGSIIKNRQYSAWELYRPQILAALAAFALLSLLILFLLGQTRQLTRARLALAGLNMNLEAQVAERTAALNQTNDLLQCEINERQQAQAALQKRLEALAIINHLDRVMTVGANLAETLGETAASLTSLFETRSAFFLLLDDQGAALRLLAGYERRSGDLSVAGYTFSLDDMPAVRQALDQEHPFILSGTALEPWSEAVGASLAALGVRSLLLAPLLAHGKALGLQALGLGAPERVFTQDEIGLVETIAGGVAAAIESARLVEQARDAAVNAALQRLGRELHDSVTQSLFLAASLADTLPRIWERDRERTNQALADLRQLTQGALAEMRTLLLEMRPESLAGQSLDGLLRQLTDGLLARTKMEVITTIEGSRPLPEDVKLAFYRIAQGALSNIVRHAQATQAVVALTYEPGQVTLHVRDDGAGFDPQNVRLGSMGLKIMREWSLGIGAAFSLTSLPGAGTEINVCWVHR